MTLEPHYGKEMITMQYLEKHPIVLFHSLTVWAACPECFHYSKLFWGYYCGCGHNSWSQCRCKAVVIERHLAPDALRPAVYGYAA